MHNYCIIYATLLRTLATKTSLSSARGYVNAKVCWVLSVWEKQVCRCWEWVFYLSGLSSVLRPSRIRSWPCSHVLIEMICAIISKPTTAYYSRQSLSRSLNKRRRNGAALEWVGSGKDIEGRAGKEKRGRIRCDTWKGETKNWLLPAAKGFLRDLSRNEMRSSYTRVARDWRE